MKNICLLKLLLLLTILTLSGCAVLDKNVPNWTQYRNPDKTQELQLAFQSAGTGDPVILILASVGHIFRRVWSILLRDHPRVVRRVPFRA